MTKFATGDRVVINDSCSITDWVGATATVIGITPSGNNVGIRLDDPSVAPGFEGNLNVAGYRLDPLDDSPLGRFRTAVAAARKDGLEISVTVKQVVEVEL